MEFHSLVQQLEGELKKPLPGEPLQIRMSAISRIREVLKFSHQSGAIRSSVLILLFPSSKEGEASLVLILRPMYDGVHSGQIALPGGRYEEADGELLNTALREAQEEIGIDPGKVQILGRLTDLYIPPSNYIVAPFIGFSSEEPVFTADPQEVDRIIIIRLKDLMEETAVTTGDFVVSNGMTITAACYDVGGYRIWGATAMILSEFREIVKRGSGIQQDNLIGHF
jgi:8-oxo-dGTP pyrophosphatase MutT (NUDIX family)